MVDQARRSEAEQRELGLSFVSEAEAVELLATLERSSIGAQVSPQAPGVKDWFRRLFLRPDDNA